MRPIHRLTPLLFTIVGIAHPASSSACKIETLIAWKDHGISVGIYRQPADPG